MTTETRKLDRRDLMLLEILAQNCRTSLTTIGHALKLSRDAVQYRVSELKKSKLITDSMLFIDARCFGLTRYHILIQFDPGFTLSADQLNRLCVHPWVMWVNSFVGCFDLQIIVDAKDPFVLDRIRSELFAVCNNRIREYLVLTHLHDYEFTQINPATNLGTRFDLEEGPAFAPLITKRRFPVGAHFQQVHPDLLHAEILHTLAEDPTMALSELAERTQCDRQTVRRKITELINKKVILNFGTVINTNALGFVTYFLLVRLFQNTPRKVVQSAFDELRSIFYAGAMLGEYDLVLYLNARNPVELDSAIARFRKDLSKYIQSYDLLLQSQVHAWRQYTKGIHETVSAVNK